MFPFRHSRENGNPGIVMTERYGFLLEFTPYLIRGRDDKKNGEHAKGNYVNI